MRLSESASREQMMRSEELVGVELVVEKKWLLVVNGSRAVAAELLSAFWQSGKFCR
jgi:hypothetical protein